MNRYSLRRLVATAVGSLAFVAFAAAQFSGAIYTSLGDGSAVNHNLYAKAEDVYLNGGPQNLTGSGLPDGYYYFQVTTPNGKLLSTDPAINRILIVENGRVAGPYGGNSYMGYPGHVPGLPDMANGGAIPVQLFPFNPTDNAGGEYKVWLIKKDEATILGGWDGIALRFSNSDAKTDNFKIGPPTQEHYPFTVLIDKYWDANHNGVLDDGETLLDGFSFEVTYNKFPTGELVTETLTGKSVSIECMAGTPYSVKEITPNDPTADHGWLQTWPALNGVPQGYERTAGGEKESTEVTFGNALYTSIYVHKFIDLNHDGVWDTNEPANDGFPLTLLVNGSLNYSLTDGQSARVFYGDSYLFTENVPTGWFRTTEDVTGTVTLPADTTASASTSIEPLTLQQGNILKTKITVHKFIDLNRNGVWDDGEPFNDTFPMTLTVNGVPQTVKDGDEVEVFLGDTYSLTETLPDGSSWFRTTQDVSGTVELPEGTVLTNTTTLGEVTLYQGNALHAKVIVHKFIDLNHNGEFNSDEPFNANFPMTLTIGGGDPKTVYDGDSFEVFPGDTCSLTETLPDGTQWINTTGAVSAQVDNPADLTIDTKIGDVTLFQGNTLKTQLTVHKFIDLNHNGVWDSGEPNNGTFPLTLAINGGAAEPVTDGQVVDLYLGDKYVLSETLPDGTQWVCTTGDVAGTVDGPATLDLSSTLPALDAAIGNILPTTLTVHKFVDLNGDGIWDPSEPTNGTFAMKLSINGGDWQTVHDGDFVTVYLGDKYVLTEDEPNGPVDGWFRTTTDVTGTVGSLEGITVGSTLDPIKIAQGNAPGYRVSVTKYNDPRGTKDPTGLNVTAKAGWPLKVTIGGVTTDQITGADGSYTTPYMKPGTVWTIVEGTQAGWVAVTGSKTSYTGTAPAATTADPVTDPTLHPFFNRQYVAPTAGRTLGFWSNKNGNAILIQSFTGWQSLVSPAFTANGSTFTAPVPTGTPLKLNLTTWNNWLLSANATNMAYMLSVQLTVQKLDIKFFGQNPNYVAGDSGMTIQEIINEATALLNTAGNNVIINAGPIRTRAEYLKTLLDKLNNNALPLYGPI